MNKIFEIKKQDLYDEHKLAWLGLDDVPQILYNPLIDTSRGYLTKDTIEEFASIFLDSNYLHLACRLLLGIELMPFQLAILETLWEKRLPLLIATRGGGKSFMLAVYSVLRMILTPGSKIVIVGSGFRQAKTVMEYLWKIWDNSAVLRSICDQRTDGKRRETDKVELRIGDSRTVGLPMGDGSKIRGERANYIIGDEMSSINEEIFNIVVQGFGIVSQDPLEKVKESALIDSLKKRGLWTDEMDQLHKLQSGGNQIIRSGTAFFEFNHFARTFKKWRSIIYSQGDPKKLKEVFGDESNEIIDEGFDWKDYAVIRIPYTHVPAGLTDPTIFSQARATLSRSQFLMEYCACFPADSDGFFKRSLLESVTTYNPIKMPTGESVKFTAKRSGDPDKKYIIGIDPAADADNAAIVVLELNGIYRNIVNCWTTNKKKHAEYKKYCISIGQPTCEYYVHIANKVKSLMSLFNIDTIVMDKFGGGDAVREALASESDEFPDIKILEKIDPEKPKASDQEEGIHILQLIAPSNEINSEANHGMLKDFQTKSLLFPATDSLELAKSIQMDNANNLVFDTYEELIEEIEELKTEISIIECTPSRALGKERFDTPDIKSEGMKKGRLRKDRYSALLYANYYARNIDKNTIVQIQYKPMGGFKDNFSKTSGGGGGGRMYYGTGATHLKKQDVSGPRIVRR